MEQSNPEMNSSDLDPAAEFLVREQHDLIGLEDEFCSSLKLDDSINNLDQSDINFDSSDCYCDNSIIDFVNSDMQFESSNSNFEKCSLEIQGIDDSCQSDNEELQRNKYYISIKSWYEENVERKLEESEKIKKWQEENRKMLEEKDAKEAKEKEDMRLQANKDLDEWYKNYEESLIKKADTSLLDDQLAVGDAENEVDTEWKRVAELCDLCSKSPHSTKDVSRMKEVILSLKQNPPLKTN